MFVSSEFSIQHLNGFEVVVSTVSDIPGMTIFKGGVNDMRSNYTVKIPNVYARFITIQRPGVLTICEIVVIEGGIYKNFNIKPNLNATVQSFIKMMNVLRPLIKLNCSFPATDFIESCDSIKLPIYVSVKNVSHEVKNLDQHFASKVSSTVLLGIVIGSLLVIIISGALIGVICRYKGAKW